MVFTEEKAKWLWLEMNKYRTLWNDFTRGDFHSWFSSIVSEDSVWLEVTKDGQPVGVVYWNGMWQIIDVQVHCMFFDRDLVSKTELCRQIACWFFITFPEVTRMTATIPAIYHTTVRLLKRIGFKEEGRKRQSLLMNGKKIDEMIFGLLASEMI
jgi:hypothetical protein